MFTLTASLTLAAAMALIDRIKLMEMPNSVLVVLSLQIAMLMLGLMATSKLLGVLKTRIPVWGGFLAMMEDTVLQLTGICMIVLSNCVIRVSVWYSGNLWVDVVQVTLAISVAQTLQYGAPGQPVQAKQRPRRKRQIFGGWFGI